MIEEKKDTVQFIPLPYDGTFESAKKCHQHLWDYLSKTGAEHKPCVAGVTCSCYACQYVNDLIDKVGNKYYKNDRIKRWHLEGIRCLFCPIVWDEELGRKSYCTCIEDSSPYSEWASAETADSRKQMAEKIRDIEFKDTEDLLVKYIKDGVIDD